MKTLEEIHESWAVDSQINNMDLAEVSRQTPTLHAKYLMVLSHTKLRLKQAELNQKALLKQKWLYYNGKMSQEEIDHLGWEYDPFNGLKVLKGEMDYYYNSDKEIQESEMKVEYLKTMVTTLIDIVDALKWRHQTIGNMIKWKLFEAGN